MHGSLASQITDECTGSQRFPIDLREEISRDTLPVHGVETGVKPLVTHKNEG